MVDHVLVNLQRNLARMDRLQNRLSSGKRVQYPSDDPASASLAMRLHSAVLENDQYRRNVEAGISWLATTDSALQDMVNTLHRARELIVAGARGDLPDSARQALADEMDQVIRHLVEVGNTTHGGRYIFGGFRTDQPPLGLVVDVTTGKLTAVKYQGSTDPAAEFKVETGPLVTVTVGTSGVRVFGTLSPIPGSPPLPPDQQPELFVHLIAARDHLAAGDVQALSNRDLQNLDADLDRILRELSRVGARQQGLELLAQRLDADQVNLKELLSKAEDLDVAEAITELKMQENVYRLALASGARIIQPTLLDFLR